MRPECHRVSPLTDVLGSVGEVGQRSRGRNTASENFTNSIITMETVEGSEAESVELEEDLNRRSIRCRHILNS